MTFDPAIELQKAFEEHRIHSIREGQTVSVPESELAVSVVLVSVNKYPNTVATQLDFRFESKKLGKRLLVESYVGLGSDETEALRDAFIKFLKASLHVLLATLVDPQHGAHQMEWDSWSLHSQIWRVGLGPIVQQGSPIVTVEYGRLLDRLRDELPPLSDEPHWLRVFFMQKGCNRAGTEALLDNKYWFEGQRVVDASDLPEGNYRVRHFLMMMPGDR